MDKIIESNLEDTIKNISIRGRMYYCSFCLKNAFEKNGIMNEEVKVILNTVLDFLESESLDLWEDVAKDISPESILDENFNINDFTMDHNLIYKLKSFYKNIPGYLVELIEYTIYVGLENLYGGTGEYSPSTLDYILRIISICEQNGINIPDINHFLKYSFKEYHGWGNLIKLEK